MQVNDSRIVNHENNKSNVSIFKQILKPFVLFSCSVKKLINKIFYNLSFSCFPREIEKKVNVEQANSSNQATTQKAIEVLKSPAEEGVSVPQPIETVSSLDKVAMLPETVPAEIRSCMQRALDPTTKEFKVMEHLRELGIGPNENTTLEEMVYRASLMADFVEREKLPQTNEPEETWHTEKWNTKPLLPLTLPEPTIPEGVDPIQWKKDRVIAVALWYEGLMYHNTERLINGKPARGHFPAYGNGLDCSNFTSWVYNFGLGIFFSCGVNDLVNRDRRKRWAKNAGRELGPNEPLQRGDLLLILAKAKGRPHHVVIYVDENTVIDSTSGKPGVGLRDIRVAGCKWYQQQGNPRYFCALRPLE